MGGEEGSLSWAGRGGELEGREGRGAGTGRGGRVELGVPHLTGGELEGREGRGAGAWPIRVMCQLLKPAASPALASATDYIQRLR